MSVARAKQEIDYEEFVHWCALCKIEEEEREEAREQAKYGR